MEMDSQNTEFKSMWLFAGNIPMSSIWFREGWSGGWVGGLTVRVWEGGNCMKYLKMVWNEKLVLRNKNKKRRGHVG